MRRRRLCLRSTTSTTNSHNSDTKAMCLFFMHRRDLVNQEARYAEQLEVAEKQAYDSQTKANDLAYQISELERNLTTKIWNVERTYKLSKTSK